MTITGVSTLSRNPAVAGDGLMLPAATAIAAPYAAAGPFIGGTSKTPNSIVVPTIITFAIEELGRSFFIGTRLRATAIDFEDVWVEGIVTEFDGLNVSIQSDLGSGVGTYSNWIINVAGEPGQTGSVGPQGIQGPSGGATGPQGVPGTPGAVWRNGNGVPLDSLGLNGDYYLNDLTGNVYYRVASVYQLVANIVGPPGAGATGAIGPQGDPGAVLVFEQASTPSATQPGAIWIDTDETAVYGPKWQKLTAAEYAALTPKDPNVLYVVIG